MDDSLEAGEWRWLMTSEGFLAAYWADVGYVKLMSNFHSPESGQVMRRMTGQADKEARGRRLLGWNTTTSWVTQTLRTLSEVCTPHTAGVRSGGAVCYIGSWTPLCTIPLFFIAGVGKHQGRSV